MAKKTKRQQEDENEGRWYRSLKEETRYSIWAIFCLGISLFFVLSVFGNAGLIGEYVYSGLKFLFGQGLFLVPALFLFVAISLFSSFRPNLLLSSLVGGVLILVSGLALAEIVFSEKTGGYVGYLVSLPFLKLVDFWASLILFLSILIVGVLIMFNIPLSLVPLRKKLIQKKLFAEEDDDVSASLQENLIELKGSAGVIEQDEEIEEDKEKNEDKKEEEGAKISSEQRKYLLMLIFFVWRRSRKTN